MKKRKFLILEIVLLVLSIVFFLLYGLFPRSIDERGVWHSIFLGLAIVLILVGLFFLFYSLLANEKDPEIHQGVICPKCHTIYPKDEDYCPNCGEKNPEYREGK